MIDTAVSQIAGIFADLVTAALPRLADPAPAGLISRFES